MRVESNKFHLLLLAGLTLVAAGCGDSKQAADKPATQVAAKVNGTELTVHQVNYALQRMPSAGTEKNSQAPIVAVRALVDQELLVQKAIETKLDRDPGVVQALDAARRQVLAQAYIGRKLAGAVPPTDAEVAAFYAEWPQLFSQRKVYHLQEISIRAPKDKLESIKTRLGETKSLEDFVAWLKTEGHPVNITQGVKPAEQLPMHVLPNLHAMKPGQILPIEVPSGLLVVRVANLRAEPVSEADAAPIIKRLLLAKKRDEAAKAELTALKSAAKVEYLGDFAAAAEQRDATAAAPKVAAKPEAATSPTAEVLGKGVSGLK